MNGKKYLIKQDHFEDVSINFAKREVEVTLSNESNIYDLVGIAAGFHDFLHIAYMHGGVVTNICTTDFKNWYLLDASE